MSVQNARLYQSEQTAREQAEHAGRTKDEFLATLSHELRTPLMPVLTAAHRMHNDPELPEKYRRAAELICRNVEMEARLIDDLLDISRIIHRKLEYSFECVDAHEVMRLALDICEAEIAEKKLRLTVQLDAARHHVHGDSGRLQQAFWNLLKNAVKFTGEGGEITVRSTNDNDASIRLEIQDTGVGIDDAHLGKIFDPFEQGSFAAARKFGGLGLGLAIAKATIDAHGGSITAESAGHEKGSTFTVRLATLAQPGELAGNEPALNNTPPPDQQSAPLITPPVTR